MAPADPLSQRKIQLSLNAEPVLVSEKGRGPLTNGDRQSGTLSWKGAAQGRAEKGLDQKRQPPLGLAPEASGEALLLRLAGQGYPRLQYPEADPK
jgi:hypothetical protein